MTPVSAPAAPGVRYATVVKTVASAAAELFSVDVVTVAGWTTSEKVARTVELTLTPVSPERGATEITVGGVRSGGAAVAKVQTKSEAMAFPARSCAPVVTRAV